MPKVGASGRNLQLLVKFARRAGNKNSAGDAALAVLYALYDAGLLAALGAVGALGSIHHFLTVGCFCDLGHVLSSSPAHHRTAITKQS